MYVTSNTTSYGISFYRYKCTQKLECVWKNFRMYCGANVPLIWFTNSLKLALVTALRLVHTTPEEFKKKRFHSENASNVFRPHYAEEI